MPVLAFPRNFYASALHSSGWRSFTGERYGFHRPALQRPSSTSSPSRDLGADPGWRVWPSTLPKNGCHSNLMLLLVGFAMVAHHFEESRAFPIPTIENLYGENGSPVILEYKRASNENVVNRGPYSAWAARVSGGRWRAFRSEGPFPVSAPGL